MSCRGVNEADALCLQVDEACRFRPVIVNPMHHTNSTAFTDWALRRPHTHLHLFERYTTGYWGVLASLATSLPVERLASMDTKEVAGACNGF